MNKIYIPEIGDKIILAKDWEVNIIGEGRNSSILEMYNYRLVNYRYIVPNTFDTSPISPIFEQLSKEFINSNKKLFESYENAKYRLTDIAHEKYKNSENYLKYVKDYENYIKKVKKESLTSINLIIPAGSILKVDRIYIRKNNSEYNSVSFWITFKNNKKKCRFFAKLKDVNNIYYEN